MSKGMTESAGRALYGMRIIESAWLTEKGEPITVVRSWRERLLTRPWRPFTRTRIVVPDIPYRGAVKLNASTLVMHPETVRTLSAELQKATQP